MKKTSLILSLALALAACQQEEPMQHEEVLAAADDFVAEVEGYSNETKTALGEGNSIVWAEGDQISIFNGNQNNKCYEIKSPVESSHNAVFSHISSAGDDSEFFDQKGNIAVYPYFDGYMAYGVYSEDGTEQIGWTVDGVNLPRVQIYRKNNFANGSFPMVATTSEKNDHLLKFKNLAAVIKLQLRGTQTIRGIYIRANNNEPLSGGYTAQALFNKHEGPTLFPYTRTWNYVFLRCDEEVKLDRYETTPFYISIPPTDFTNGFTIEIVDTEGNSYTKTAARTNVERSSILVMPTLTVNKLEVVEDVIDIPEDGSSVDITVKCGGNWYTSHAPEWLNISSEKVSEDTYVVSVSMKENYATYDYENTYIEFESFLASDRVTVLKERPISTVEEVNTGVEGEEYRLKGYVTDITNTSYGNWSLMDETGSIYIYGTAKEGYYKSFSTFGIEAGDIVTIQGPREKYGDIIRLNTATVVNIEKSLIKIKEVVGLEGNMIPVEGAEFSIKVDCAGNDITVNIPEGTQSWLSSNSTEWINDTEAVVYFTAQAAPKGARPVKITFETYSDEGVKHINQIGLVQYGNIIECTIEEFLKEPVSEYCLYKLTGTVENIKNATYGNFYLNDGTGTVYVYGLTTKGEIGANDKSFASIGLEEGDILTLVGTRTEYNGTPQVGGQAYYVSHISNN